MSNNDPAGNIIVLTQTMDTIAPALTNPIIGSIKKGRHKANVIHVVDIPCKRASLERILDEGIDDIAQTIGETQRQRGEQRLY